MINCRTCGSLGTIKGRKICQPCRNKQQKFAKERRGGYSEKDKRRMRNWELVKNFGISIEEYELLSEQQNGKCAICNNKCSTGRSLSVDHCHETGRIRGLLCKNCNVGIGLLGDNVSGLENALRYLRMT